MTGMLEKKLNEALRAADGHVADRDVAAVQLARRYAQLLDEARGQEDEVKTFTDLGPRLLAALSSVGLTLAGRATKGRGGEANEPKQPVNAFDQLRELRARRNSS